MSRTLTIPDQLFERLDRVARGEGLASVEDWLARIVRAAGGDERSRAVSRIRNLRGRLEKKHGRLADSTSSIREDRAR